MSAVAFGGGREPGQGLRWTGAVLLVAAVHAGAGWWFVGRSFLPPFPPEGVAGVTIDLDPVAVPVPPTAEPKPMETAGPAPEPQVAEAPEAQPEPPPPAAAPPVEAAVAPPPEPAPPVPQQKSDPAPPPAPAPEAAQPVAPPPAPAVSDAVLAPPPPPRPVVLPKKVVKPPKPVPLKPVPPKPDPREVARQEAREAQAEARDEAREEARREARSQAASEARAQRQAAREARAARAAATREGGGADSESAAPRASGASVASWRGEVAAHLNAYKPASPDGSDGTVGVAFSVDRGGRVVSASVSRSSGDAALDQAAVSMVRRASPVPAPPPEMGGRVSVAVPVHFH